MSGLEKKFATKSKIVNYIINRESTSKVEISKELNLSMPTVLSNVKDLLEKGIIIETGEYDSRNRDSNTQKLFFLFCIIHMIQKFRRKICHLTAI